MLMGGGWSLPCPAMAYCTTTPGAGGAVLVSFEEESDGGGSDDIDLLVDEFEGFE